MRTRVVASEVRSLFELSVGGQADKIASDGALSVVIVMEPPEIRTLLDSGFASAEVITEGCSA